MRCDVSSPTRYQADLIIQHWQNYGFEVTKIYGTGRFVPADAIFVHVDASLVPEEYLEFAQRYPRVINGQVRDIRKRSYSVNLVSADAAYTGPVIVKTSLNSAGSPEVIRKRMPHRRYFWNRVRWRLFGRGAEIILFASGQG